MSCANNVLPVYMWPSPGKIPEALCLPPVQVDTLHFSSEATETNGFSRLSSSLNRTAVILDMNLPGLAGLDILMHLRGVANEDIPVIMITGQGDLLLKERLI